jgi:hypothetical protein
LRFVIGILALKERDVRLGSKTSVLLSTILALPACGKKSRGQTDLDSLDSGFRSAGKSVSDQFVDLLGVDTNEKRKPLVIYYAVNRSAEPLMAIQVTRDLQRLRIACAQGIDSVAFVNSHYAESRTKSDEKFFVLCRNKNISVPKMGSVAKEIERVIDEAAKGIEPSNSPISLKYTEANKKYAAEFKKSPYAHPRVMKILLEHAISLFPADKYTYFLHVKSHGAKVSGNDAEKALVMTGLTDEALRIKRWGKDDESNEGQIHSLVANSGFKSQAELTKAIGGFIKDKSGKMVFVGGGREGIAQTLKIDQTSEKNTLTINCGPGDCLSADDFQRLDISSYDTLDISSYASLDISSAQRLNITNGYELDISNTGTLSAENYFGTDARVMKELLTMVFNGKKALKFALFESCGNSFGRSEAAREDLQKRVKGKPQTLNLSMFYSPTGSLGYVNFKWDEIAKAPNATTTVGLQYALIPQANKVMSQVSE